MRTYQYRCHDYSLLTPTFKKWIVTPLIRIMPWAIPANIITFVSNAFVYAGLYLALNPDIFGQLTPIAISLTFVLYLIGDHLDGMQAKRTGTGSALGEFCDHYLDAFNNGIIMYTMLIIFEISNPAIVAGLIVISYWAHMAVFYEQFKTGWLTFEAIGSLEGVLLSALLVALSTLQSIRALFAYSVFQGISLIEILLILSALGALVTFYKTWKRTPEVKTGFIAFCALLSAAAVLMAFYFSTFQMFVVLTLYASLYIGKIMHGHLIDGVEKSADYVTPIILLLLLIPDFGYSNYVYVFVTVWLSVSIGILIVRTFSVLKVYWVWFNLRTKV